MQGQIASSLHGAVLQRSLVEAGPNGMLLLLRNVRVCRSTQHRRRCMSRLMSRTATRYCHTPQSRPPMCRPLWYAQTDSASLYTICAKEPALALYSVLMPGQKRVACWLILWPHTQTSITPICVYFLRQDIAYMLLTSSEGFGVSWLLCSCLEILFRRSVTS